MTPSVNCLDLIKQYEGFREEAYLCPAGVWTIGYGTTKGVKKGDKITEEEATKNLLDDIFDAAEAINDLVDCELSQNQYDALCSLIYNIGRNAFKTSTLLRLLNANNYTGASQQFGRWIKADGKDMPGLIRRRKAERELFDKE